MEFSLPHTLQVLERTPAVLESLLGDLDIEWTRSNEGPETFSPFDVVGHLVHGEKTDWMVRAKIILNEPERVFDRYDRFAQYEESKCKTMDDLLREFRTLREKNIADLKALDISAEDLSKTGTHPVLGTVTLQQLMACWTVHDLSHLGQITRVMAKQYKTEVGPWIEFLPILTR